MTRWGRRWTAPIGVLGAAAMLLLLAPKGRAETIKTEIEMTTKEIGTKESRLGQTIADAVREIAKADVAILAASSFTDDITLPKGKADTADFVKALDFKGDAISVLKLTGAQIRKAMEHSLYLFPKTNSGFLQFAGMKVTINPDADKEARVVSITIGDEPIKSDKTYKVAMPAPLADGALGYSRIWKKTDLDKESEKELKDKTLESAVTLYLKGKKSLAKGEDRLVVKGK
jgi:2',3'-cyclic-nucleotide 2'-phosphodiesterase (5'-nucleotidase family)